MSQQGVFREGLFDGQVALITGGGSGIGRGIADLLASLGAHVVLASRKLERLEAASAEIRAGGGKASAVAVDVRDPERVNAAVILDIGTQAGRPREGGEQNGDADGTHPGNVARGRKGGRAGHGVAACEWRLTLVAGSSVGWESLSGGCS